MILFNLSSHDSSCNHYNQTNRQTDKHGVISTSQHELCSGELTKKCIYKNNYLFFPNKANKYETINPIE